MTDLSTAEHNARAALARDPKECVAITAEEACALFDRVRELEAERDRAESHAVHAERVAAMELASAATWKRLAEDFKRERDEQIEATVCERELWEIFADCRWEEVWARDAALEACQERIAGLLAVLATERDRKRSWMHLANRFFAERDKARSVADALASQNATLQATVLGLLAVLAETQEENDLWRDNEVARVDQMLGKRTP